MPELSTAGLVSPQGPPQASRARLLEAASAVSRKDSRNQFRFGTTTTSISGPEVVDSMRQTRSLSTTSLGSNVATRHLLVRSPSIAASNRGGEDEGLSIMSGLRQHPVSMIAEKEGPSFEQHENETPGVEQERSSNTTNVIVGRDSLRPWPATRGFGVSLRDSSRTTSSSTGGQQTWPIKEALESPRSDQFEYDSSKDPSALQQQRRMTDISSATDSLYNQSNNRTSQATSAFLSSGLSHPRAPITRPENNNTNPFLDTPQVPGMVYMPTRLTAFQSQQQQQQQEAPRTLQPFPFAQAVTGGPAGSSEGGHLQPPPNRPEGQESSKESLVEVTDLRKGEESPALPSPGSHFSRPTSIESGGMNSELSSDGGSEILRLAHVETAGFGVSVISDNR
ncbi:hypothetical protein N0V82_009554 [Gnomoniopsis sp. IMI 355080]|nr:hypothetical protein N0V82_009554 [Gnomoniopsis sp. IMI 355080]